MQVEIKARGISAYGSGSGQWAVVVWHWDWSTWIWPGDVWLHPRSGFWKALLSLGSKKKFVLALHAAMLGLLPWMYVASEPHLRIIALDFPFIGFQMHVVIVFVGILFCEQPFTVSLLVPFLLLECTYHY